MRTRFQVLFHSPSGVLFTFPSRYFCAIGHSLVFSLGGWSPLIQTGFHVPRLTRDTDSRSSTSTTGLSPAKGGLSIPLRLVSYAKCPSHNPGSLRFGLFPLRSPLLRESRLISFPPATEMFQFTGLAALRLCVQLGASWIAPGGFSHSDTQGSMAVCASPWLFAACRVLLRRRMPRHPPCAL